jgi:hypothetical protein
MFILGIRLIFSFKTKISKILSMENEELRIKTQFFFYKFSNKIKKLLNFNLKSDKVSL